MCIHIITDRPAGQPPGPATNARSVCRQIPFDHRGRSGVQECTGSWTAELVTRTSLKPGVRRGRNWGMISERPLKPGVGGLDLTADQVCGTPRGKSSSSGRAVASACSRERRAPRPETVPRLGIGRAWPWERPSCWPWSRSSPPDAAAVEADNHDHVHTAVGVAVVRDWPGDVAAHSPCARTPQGWHRGAIPVPLAGLDANHALRRLGPGQDALGGTLGHSGNGAVQVRAAARFLCGLRTGLFAHRRNLACASRLHRREISSALNRLETPAARLPSATAAGFFAGPVT